MWDRYRTIFEAIIQTSEADEINKYPNGNRVVHCKKRVPIFQSPAAAGMSLTNLPGMITLFLARESLVSDIPAGDGKIAELFYIVSKTDFPLLERQNKEVGHMAG